MSSVLVTISGGSLSTMNSWTRIPTVTAVISTPLRSSNAAACMVMYVSFTLVAMNGEALSVLISVSVNGRVIIVLLLPVGVSP